MMNGSNASLDIENIQGLWQRDWLLASGFADESTRVFWGQTGGRFVDIRIPLDRPKLGESTCLAELDAPSLARLLRAEAFAGHITLDDSVCTWHREINWHGQTDDIDAGALWFSADGTTLMEDGVHTNYQEQWQRVPHQCFNSFTLSSGSLSGYLLLSKTRFMLGVGDKDAPSTQAVRDDLHQGILPAALQRVFASQYCIGSWDGQQGLVEFSTNPFCENTTVLNKDGDTLTWLHHAFDGTQSRHRVELAHEPPSQVTSPDS